MLGGKVRISPVHGATSICYITIQKHFSLWFTLLYYPKPSSFPFKRSHNSPEIGEKLSYTCMNNVTLNGKSSAPAQATPSGPCAWESLFQASIPGSTLVPV